ncbi:hypothetical protein OKA06_04390 [Novosphingobium sp. MW5]|nr:hypothetical protein [Novosphingobium sp. MW5]
MITLMPRLPAPSAEAMLDRLLDGETLRWPGFDQTSLPEETRFGATGGSAADPAQLRDLRLGLVAAAEEHGFGTSDARAAHSKFDAAMGAWLAGQPVFGTGEALRDDVWSFIGVVVAPDIVHWRFGKSKERYLGGVRNTFQRLWMRARVLDRGEGAADRWGLLDSLTEDALVQITERPSIGADAVLARALAEAWVRASVRFGKRQMEDVMRLTILRLRIRNEIRSLSLLPEGELADLLDQFFDSAAKASGGAQGILPSDVTQETSNPASDSPASAASGAPEPSRRSRSWAIWRAR